MTKSGRITGIVGGTLMVLGAAWKILAYVMSKQGGGGSGVSGAIAVTTDLLGMIAMIAAAVPLLAGIAALSLSLWYPVDGPPGGKAAAIAILACGGLGLLAGAGFNTGALVIVGALAALVAGILLLIDANGEDRQASGQAPPV